VTALSPGPRIGTTLWRAALAIVVAFGGIGAGAGYWQVLRSDELAGSPDDAGVVAASRRVARGEILDRDGRRLAWNLVDANGEPYRIYASRSLSGVLGYASRAWGTSGLERAWDPELSGVVAADPLRGLFRKFLADPSDPQTITTTLSLPLQEAAAKALGSDPGAVVVLDPRTGEVLALVSTPTFDASAVADPVRGDAAFRALQADPALPLLPRATQGRYVPGSVFKIVTAIAGIGSGAITPGLTFAEQPAAEKTGLLVDGFRVRDGHHPATGATPVDFTTATEVSCNVWFALAGLRVGGDVLVDRASRLGFGAPIPFDLTTVASQVTDGDGPQPGGFLDDVELANAAYGQGRTLVTPLQMALVAATVANGGDLMRPYLVSAAAGRSGTTTIEPRDWRRVLSRPQSDEIVAAMEAAVNGSLGRPFTKGAAVPGLLVAGKSGTAELDPGESPHSWFIGFAPADAPRVAIAVIVENGAGGTRKAAPIAGTVLAAWKRLFGGAG
jgi:peptidoglycan glycosyltransferase